ncbi:GTPase family protein [Escherichia albertii]
MEESAKTVGRWITDSKGNTRREGGIFSQWQQASLEDSDIVQQDNSEPLIKNILDIFPESLRASLFSKISEAIDYEPVIGVMGKTGAGKSALCNALFKGEVCAVSDVEACTRDVQELRIRFGRCSLKIVDIPGVGENALRDKEYEDLYHELLPEMDLILWVVKGDDRAFSADEHFYTNVLVPTGGGERILFVLNQVDKVGPFREWDIVHHQPSAAQLINIEKKKSYIAERFGFTRYPVIAVSAGEGYNILLLVETMIRALPDKAKSGATAQLKDEYKTEEVKADAKDGFASVISEVLDMVIDASPLPAPVKEFAHKCKDKVIGWASDFWDDIFN